MGECKPFDLFVIGAGGHALELNAYIEDLKRLAWNGRLVGFADDRVAPGLRGGLNILGPIDKIPIDAEEGTRIARYITALGNNLVRRTVVERLANQYGERLTPWTLVHPSAYIGQNIDIGEGTCVAPHSVLTAAVRIGIHCIVNVKASVSHECKIGDFCNINPSVTICGNVEIGDGVYLGAGSTVRDNVKIGSWSIIGAGAVVHRDIPDNVTAVGVPARIVKNIGYKDG